MARETEEAFNVNLRDVESIFDRYIAEVEEKAEINWKRQKWIMHGYYKAIGVHLRKLKRKIRTDIISHAIGFPTRHEREDFTRKEGERLEKERRAAFEHPTRRRA